MKILKATHLGMCFGVRDAINLALSQTGPTTVLGQLVHNASVTRELERRGIGIAEHPNEVASQTVMITAHGASQKRLQEVKRRGHRVLEATCPLVHAAHDAVHSLVAEGYHPVIVGKRDHVEVRGITEDLAEYDVVLTRQEVGELTKRPKFGVAAQTTQPIEHVRRLVALIKQRFPGSDVRFADTVCLPTKLRQQAAVRLAQQCDVVLVIGGSNSNNTHGLAKTCSHHCSRVHHIQTASDLREDWFRHDDTVGITAGTSTPDTVVAAVEDRLAGLARELPSATKKAVQHRTHNTLAPV